MSGQEHRRIEPRAAVGVGGWAPFGWLPVADTDPADGDERMTFLWDDVHVNIIGHARAEVPRGGPGGLRCEMLFRHDTHTQSIMALDVPAVIAVGLRCEVRRCGRRDIDQGLPARTAAAPGAAPGDLALGPVPDRGGRRGAPLQRAGPSLRRGQCLCRPGRAGHGHRGGRLRDERRDPAMEIDETEIHGRARWPSWWRPSPRTGGGPAGAGGRATFTTTSPDWWPGERTFGGMVVAQALHAAFRTVPAGIDVALAARLLPAPSRPGVPSFHRVERARDGRSFSTREVTSEVEGKAASSG